MRRGDLVGTAARRPRSCRPGSRGPRREPRRRWRRPTTRTVQACRGAPGREVTVWPPYPVPALARLLAPVGFASGKGKVKEPDEQEPRPS
ncbi:hypothetical protein B1H29_26080 [Streptomyces pactum]|uniref:Uncharacterized protein n=1 Tax=Streptomyces pactum TaxID=68249 RepID=A0A1S6JDP8_9ACTN|nr:hypothetical protein B1H29_26080 [Streptomyces pactum]